MRYVGTVSTGPLALSDYFELEDASDVHNQPLWHYTDAAGLSGILTSGKIRATHVAHLNDPTEIVQVRSWLHCWPRISLGPSVRST